MGAETSTLIAIPLLCLPSLTLAIPIAFALEFFSPPEVVRKFAAPTLSDNISFLI